MKISKHALSGLTRLSFILLIFSTTVLAVLLTNQCTTRRNAIFSQPFGKTADGKEINLYTLENKNGIKVNIINYGGSIISLLAPDRKNKFESIVLGFDSLKGYTSDNPFFGAIIGRYANRIAKGKFSIDGNAYTLSINSVTCHLHGGNIGFNKVVWTAEIIKDNNINVLKLSYLSHDGEEGYPGNLAVLVTYNLTDNNELVIKYSAETDKKTILNLTNHSYFNLAAKGDILDHILTINADSITPIDEEMLPTGEVLCIQNTPFDFTKPEKIGARIDQVKGGYDHNYVLTKVKDSIQLAATLYDPASGRKMDVLTTQPGMQFYSGNFLNGTLTLANNRKDELHSGLCLETQHFPNSPNKPNFPSTILNPGQKFSSTTIYRFYTDNN